MMLVYRDSKLVYNRVRVDWEAVAAGIEELLIKCVISLLSFLFANGVILTGLDITFYRRDIRIPIIDEDDNDSLIWSDGKVTAHKGVPTDVYCTTEIARSWK